MAEVLDPEAEPAALPPPPVPRFSIAPLSTASLDTALRGPAGRTFEEVQGTDYSTLEERVWFLNEQARRQGSRRRWGIVDGDIHEYGDDELAIYDQMVGSAATGLGAIGKSVDAFFQAGQSWAASVIPALEEAQNINALTQNQENPIRLGETLGQYRRRLQDPETGLPTNEFETGIYRKEPPVDRSATGILTRALSLMDDPRLDFPVISPFLRNTVRPAVGDLSELLIGDRELSIPLPYIPGVLGKPGEITEYQATPRELAEGAVPANILGVGIEFLPGGMLAPGALRTGARAAGAAARGARRIGEEGLVGAATESARILGQAPPPVRGAGRRPPNVYDYIMMSDDELREVEKSIDFSIRENPERVRSGLKGYESPHPVGTAAPGRTANPRDYRGFTDAENWSVAEGLREETDEGILGSIKSTTHRMYDAMDAGDRANALDLDSYVRQLKTEAYRRGLMPASEVPWLTEGARAAKSLPAINDLRDAMMLASGRISDDLAMAPRTERTGSLIEGISDSIEAKRIVDALAEGKITDDQIKRATELLKKYETPPTQWTRPAKGGGEGFDIIKTRHSLDQIDSVYERRWQEAEGTGKFGTEEFRTVADVENEMLWPAYKSFISEAEGLYAKYGSEAESRRGLAQKLRNLKSAVNKKDVSYSYDMAHDFMDELEKITTRAAKGDDVPVTRVYHGTAKDFEGAPSGRGEDLYVTRIPEVASEYAEVGGEFGGRVYPMDLQGKVLDPFSDEYENIIKAARAKHGDDPWSKSEFIDELVKKGYAGIEAEGQEEIIVLNEAALKPAFGPPAPQLRDTLQDAVDFFMDETGAIRMPSFRAELEWARKIDPKSEILDLISLPKGIKSMIDRSAILRQGGLLIRHGEEVAKNLARTMVIAENLEDAARWEKRLHLPEGSVPNAEEVMDSMHQRPTQAIREKHKLHESEWGPKARLEQREETFSSRLGEFLPGWKMSERSFAVYLNRLRGDVYDKVIEGWIKHGRVFENDEWNVAMGLAARSNIAGPDGSVRGIVFDANKVKQGTPMQPKIPGTDPAWRYDAGGSKLITDKHLSDLAHYINVATGRGSLGSLEAAAKDLHRLWFSPRNVVARFELLSMLVDPRVSGMVRWEMAKDLSTYLGTGASLAGLAYLGGANVELDPRSSDFGKIRIGDTRVDLWGGYQQMARTAFQLYSGETKTQAGDIRDIDAWETVGRYVRGKLSPSAGVGISLLEDEDYAGQPISLSRVLEDLFVPFFIDDVYRAMKYEGVQGLLTTPISFLGGSVQRYEESLQKQLADEVKLLPLDMREDTSGGGPAERWSQLTEAQQIEAARYSPKIAKLLGEQVAESKPTPASEVITSIKTRRSEAWEGFQETGNGKQFRDRLDSLATEARGAFSVIMGGREETDPDRQLVNRYFNELAKAGDDFEQRDRLETQFRNSITVSQNKTIDAALTTTENPEYQALKVARQYLDQHYWTAKDNVYLGIRERASDTADIKKYPTYNDLAEAAARNDARAKQMKASLDKTISEQMVPLRYADPKTDAYLYIYGYRPDVASTQARDMVMEWAQAHHVNLVQPRVKR